MAYTKTEWEDLPSTNTPITADNLNHMEDGIEQVANDIDNMYEEIGIMHGAIETWASLSYSGAAIAGSDSDFNGFNTITSNGNVTTASNGVTIGNGVNCVLVSCSFGIQNATANYDLSYIGIRVNGTQIYSTFHELRNSNGAQGTVTIPAIPIEVSQGDIITCYANGQAATNIRRAILNVIGLY